MERGARYQHPELREGEVFLTNSSFSHEDYQRIVWKTKRAGHTAYDVEGKVVKNCFPVFVQTTELDKAGVKLS